MRRSILPLLAGILLVFVAHRAQSQTQTIFDYASAWKYLDNGSNQGTAWSGTSFSDAAWGTASGVFGYGDSWVTTYVNACGAVAANPSCTNKYITTYFRKTINIADVNLFDSVRFNVWRDDGMVIYVNGVEVWRDNLPASPATITYTTTGLTAIGEPAEYTPVTKSVPISAFVNGSNVIAVEIHQQSGSSSDLTFNMQALGVIRTGLFAYGSAWKFLATPTDQGTAWRASSFNDAAWATGTGHMGFSETWTNTCIPAGAACPSYGTGGPCGSSVSGLSGCNKYTTTYFRKTISVPDPSVFDSIRFSVFRDDGFVMYVNGVMVTSDNMPATYNYATFAPNNVTGTTGVWAESLAVVKTIPISYFTAGNNVVAIELHQNSLTSSDLDFNVQATGVLRTPAIPVTLSQGPYLNMGNKTAVTIRWRTNVASRSRVQVGTVVGTYPVFVNDATAVTDHEIRVTGLNPDTRYFYRIGTDTSVIQGDTANFFVTAPADTSTRRVTVAAFGDCGRNDNSFQATSLAAYRTHLAAQGMKSADVMLLAGDNAYDAGTDAEFSSNFFSRYSGNILKNHMLFPAPGNHDYANSSARQADHIMPYYNLFTMPAAAECGGVPSGTEAYYSFNWGNVHFLSLDSYGKENAGTTRLYDTNGAQVNWIKADLAANTSKWVIAYWHHPPFTKGSHNSDTEGELIEIRQKFIRILERYGVDVIICGHSHDYERSYLLKDYFGTEASFNKTAHTADSSSAKYNGTANSCPYITQSGHVNHGTVYVVSGSAGADGGVQSGYPHDALPFSIDDGGMFFLDIQDNRLNAKFLRRDNTIGDQFTIMKDVEVNDTISVLHGDPVTLTASWVGAYAWAPGSVTRTISVTATADTVVTVKDSLANTCIIDRHFIDVQCTMPAFTSCPSDIVTSGCSATVAYAVADTGRPAPSLTYAFAGATIGSGVGSGSGSAFNTGVTHVTVTASNTCGNAACSFDITVNVLPAAVAVSGGGDVCGSTTLVAANGGDGVIYFQGTTAGGISTAIPSSSEIITSPGTYYFRAQGADGCWSNDVPASVTVHSVPAATTVSGGGTFCGAATLAASNGGDGTIYFQNTTSGGVSTAAAASSMSVSASGIYYFRTRSSAGCWGAEGSAVVTVNALPATQSVTGGCAYCAGGAGVSIGLASSQTGVNYMLYAGSAAIGAPVPGTGGAISFGSLTAAGNYTVAAVDAATSCAGDMAGSASVIVNDLPPVYSVTGGGSYCAGGAGVAVGLGGSLAGIRYQLYNGSAMMGAPVTGTGAPVAFGSQTAAGAYSVVATNIATACVGNMMGAASVTITPVVVPSVSISSSIGLSACTGTAATFTSLVSNGGAAPLYQWRVNGTPAGTMAMHTYTPSNGDVVSVRLTSTAACALPDTAVAAVTMTVDPYVLPNVTIAAAPGSILCEGSPVTFTAAHTHGGTAPAFTWLRNSVVVSTSPTYSVVPGNGDDFILSMTSNKPCRLATNVYSNSISMTMAERYLPSVAISVTPGVVIQPGMSDTLTATVTGGGPAPTYQWVKNGSVIPGATTSVYISSTFANDDSVSCMVKGTGICGLPTYNFVRIKVNTTGLHTLQTIGLITVQPNPNGGEFVVTGKIHSGEPMNLSVTNVLGQLVYDEEIVFANNDLDHKVVLNRALPGGTYLFTVRSVSGLQTFRLIVNR
ncbi:MAG: metallophosphoesterase [Bacteroidota bacterium]